MKSIVVLIIGTCYTAGLFLFMSSHHVLGSVLLGLSVALSVCMRKVDDAIAATERDMEEDTYYE